VRGEAGSEFPQGGGDRYGQRVVFLHQNDDPLLGSR
jgi:hypothetical protein